MAYDLSEYITVDERIRLFYEMYEDGSLQGEWALIAGIGIVYKAYAYRTADDRRPGIGHASEPVPGLTPYTKNSELANAETSAWGRAIVALGIGAKKGIASADEVRNRTGGEAVAHARTASPVPVAATPVSGAGTEMPVTAPPNTAPTPQPAARPKAAALSQPAAGAAATPAAVKPSDRARLKGRILALPPADRDEWLGYWKFAAVSTPGQLATELDALPDPKLRQMMADLAGDRAVHQLMADLAAPVLL